MLKKLIRGILIALGVGVILLFIWQTWGQDGRLSEFFIMLWDWFYTVCDAFASALRTAFSDLQ